MVKTDAQVMGLRLKKARLAKGLAQEAAAHDLDISVGTLSKYELGKQVPGSDVLRAIAVYYGTSMDDLLEVSRPETELVLDDPPGLTDYEEAEGRLEQRYRDSVLGLAASEGPDSITADVVARHVETLKAIDRGKRIRRPAVEPDAPTASSTKRKKR